MENVETPVKSQLLHLISSLEEILTSHTMRPQVIERSRRLPPLFAYPFYNRGNQKGKQKSQKCKVEIQKEEGDNQFPILISQLQNIPSSFIFKGNYPFNNWDLSLVVVNGRPLEIPTIEIMLSWATKIFSSCFHSSNKRSQQIITKKGMKPKYSQRVLALWFFSVVLGETNEVSEMRKKRGMELSKIVDFDRKHYSELYSTTNFHQLHMQKTELNKEDA